MSSWVPVVRRPDIKLRHPSELPFRRSFWTSANPIPVGMSGVGKIFLAQVLGYSAVRTGDVVRFVHAGDVFKSMAQARVDDSQDCAFRSFLAPGLLTLDGLGLHGLTAHQSVDLYELILNRHRASSFVITSNQAVDEWLSLLDDPILATTVLGAPIGDAASVRSGSVGRTDLQVADWRPLQLTGIEVLLAA